MNRLLYFLPIVSALLIGCSIDPGKNPDPIDVTGTVTVGGKPVSDVVFNLQVTGTGTQAAFPVKNGKFQGKATPGRYTYFISEGSRPASFKMIPEKYRSGSLERQIDVNSSNTSLTFTLD